MLVFMLFGLALILAWVLLSVLVPRLFRDILDTRGPVALAALGVLLMGCTRPTDTGTGPSPVVININNNQQQQSGNTGDTPGTTVPGTGKCATVVSVGVNLPESISIAAPAQTYKLDTTPRGAGGTPLDPTCTPLPAVSWHTSAECSVSEPTVFNPFLRGVSVGTCAVYSVVGGVKAPTEFVTVLP